MMTAETDEQAKTQRGEERREEERREEGGEDKREHFLFIRETRLYTRKQLVLVGAVFAIEMLQA